MPTQTERIHDLKGASDPSEGQLPYISKSRLKQYTQCPERFRYTYLLGLREKENFWMRRGTDIHEVYEDYYYSLRDEVEESGEWPDNLTIHLPAVTRWSDYLNPFISNFIRWERERFERVKEAGFSPEMALPTGIEEEGWWEEPLDMGDDLPDGIDEAPWMGFADVIFNGEAFGYPEGSGKVIVDFKTGSVPDEKYRDRGIYLEGEYYGMIFEASGMVVESVAGYYPKEGLGGTFIESPSSGERRVDIEETIAEMQVQSASVPAELEIKEGPLCRYGEDSSEGCPFQESCRQTWNNPIENKERFIELVEQGASQYEIATELDMNTVDPVSYWKYKLDL